MLDDVTDGGKPKDSSSSNNFHTVQATSDEATLRLSSIPIAVNNGKSNNISNNMHGKLCTVRTSDFTYVCSFASMVC